MNTRDRYLLEALIELAAAHPEPLTVAEIARRRDMPEPYLGRLLAAANRAGIVVTSRGPHGGVVLADRPAAITVGRVVPLPRSEPASGIAVRWLGDEIRRRSLEVLSNTTLADLLAREREAQRALTWQI